MPTLKFLPRLIVLDVRMLNFCSETCIDRQIKAVGTAMDISTFYFIIKKERLNKEQIKNTHIVAIVHLFV